ncbi:MAG: PH domain-containing protein [Chloroflexi bacterium]|nr:PH domain-containing protein [Chloroflexota bacterium]
MNYVGRLMGTNERLVLVTRKHVIVILRALITHGLLALLIIAVSALLAFPLLLLAVVIPLGLLIMLLLRWSNEQYIVTNRRVMQVAGVINKHVADSSLEKVNDVVLDQSFLGRLMNYGNVEIITGSDVGVNQFKNIARPVDFKRAMLNQKEALGDTDGLQARTRRVLESDAPSKGDVPELIAELDELRKKGIISDAEFQTKKADLLKRL